MTSNRTCRDCSEPVAYTGRGAPRLRCDDCRRIYYVVAQRLAKAAETEARRELIARHREEYRDLSRTALARLRGEAGMAERERAAPGEGKGKLDRECRHCGTAFQAERVVAVFCSPTCRHDHRAANPKRRRTERDRERERARSRIDGPSRSPRWRKIRLLVLASHPPCGICREAIDYELKWPDPNSAQVDHITSWRLGGAWFDLSNLQAAHFRCNASKNTPVGRVRSALEEGTAA